MVKPLRLSPLTSVMVPSGGGLPPAAQAAVPPAVERMPTVATTAMAFFMFCSCVSDAGEFRRTRDVRSGDGPSARVTERPGDDVVGALPVHEKWAAGSARRPLAHSGRTPPLWRPPPPARIDVTTETGSAWS